MKLFHFPETSLLYSRVRSERNQSNNSGTNEPGRANGSTSGAGGASSAGAGTPNNVGAGSGATGGGSGAGTSATDRDSFSRWRDRQYYGPRRWFQRDESGWDKEAAGNYLTFFLFVTTKKKCNYISFYRHKEKRCCIWLTIVDFR